MAFAARTILTPRGPPTPARCRRPAMTATAAAPARAQQWETPAYGAIDNLARADVAVPPPAAGAVRVRVRAIGLNFADVFACLGIYEYAGPAPLVPGFEVCGTVDAVGPGVSEFVPGDRVFALTSFGAYTTMINTPQEYAYRLPDGWSFEEGAAYPAQSFTAWYALCVLGGIPSTGARPLQVTSEQKTVLVHSAAGGVGSQLVSMIQKIGGEVVCTIGSERKLDLLRERGIPRERIIVRGVDDVNGFEEAVRERALNGRGVDVIVDSVMGEYFDPGFQLLNTGGRYVVMGSASLMPGGALSLLKGGIISLLKLGWKYLNRPQLDMVKAINENKSVAAFNLAGLFDQIKLMETGFRELAEMDLPKPTVGRTFKFGEVKEALKFFQSGQSVGKLVLVVDEDEL